MQSLHKHILIRGRCAEDLLPDAIVLSGKKQIWCYPPQTSIRLVDTVVNPFDNQKPRIEYSSVRSFWTGRFDPIIQEGDFIQKPVNIRGRFYRNCKFGITIRSNSNVDMMNMMPDIVSIPWNAPYLLLY